MSFQIIPFVYVSLVGLVSWPTRLIVSVYASDKKRKDQDALFRAVQHALDIGINEDDPIMQQALDAMIKEPKRLAEKKAESNYKRNTSSEHSHRIRRDASDQVRTANYKPNTSRNSSHRISRDASDQVRTIKTTK